MPRPPLAERARASLRLRALDLSDRLRGRAGRRVPPRRLQLAGRADYVASGDELLALLVDPGGLKPHDAVLDVLCGAGLLARPLAAFLSPRGSYDGFDADREAIGWCRRRYGGDRRFGFRVADLYDHRRNPGGAHRHAGYRFPYDDASFDFVILESVLTRLLEEAAARFVAEAARVLRPGGRAFVTAFVLDDEARAALADGRSGLPFLDPGAHVAVVSEDVPEEAVAYDGGWLRERLDASGLDVPGDVRRGSWTGGEEHTTFQDIIVATRRT